MVISKRHLNVNVVDKNYPRIENILFDTKKNKTILGINNIWADTGDIQKAEYVRDATTIINQLIARIEALENT